MFSDPPLKLFYISLVNAEFTGLQLCSSAHISAERSLMSRKKEYTYF